MSFKQFLGKPYTSCNQAHLPLFLFVLSILGYERQTERNVRSSAGKKSLAFGLPFVAGKEKYTYNLEIEKLLQV